MTQHADQYHSDSQNLTTYLVATRNAFGAYLEFGDDHHVHDMDDCYCSVGFYQADSASSAIGMATDELIAQGCTEEYLGKIRLAAFVHEPEVYAPLKPAKATRFSFVTMVAGYEFLQTLPLDDGMDKSPESLWRQAIQHSHLRTDDRDQLKKWIEEGLKEGYVDLDFGYRIEEPYLAVVT